MKSSLLSYSIKDLSFALFMGSPLDAKYKNIHVANRNRKIIEFFSRPIAQLNKEVFRQKIAEKLSSEQRAIIKEVTDNKQPLSDSYGRITFFYIVLGGEVLPIYQPGTIMFESAVLEGADIALHSKGMHQNGPVLSADGALFLAKFLATVVSKYNQLCTHTAQNSSALHTPLET